MTTTVEVGVAPPYAVHIGRGALAGVRAFLSDATDSNATGGSTDTTCAVLSDGRVTGLHAAKLAGFGDTPWIQVPEGEAGKTFDVLERVLGEMAQAGLDRSSVLITLGGGAVSDVGGLAASLYARGIGVLHCPTTLLAQVDASVGGKTAVNLEAGKNLAGTFHQPRAVFADVDTLTTLDAEQRRSGFGEVVKTALLGAEGLADTLDAGAHELEPIVAACVRLKARVVAADEHEGGTRKQLNLGHTFAHAIEHVAGYGAVPHGVAVGVGLALALEASRRTGRLEDADLVARATGWLRALELPASLAELGVELPAEALADAMRLDKKGHHCAPRFVLPRALGAVELDVELEPALLAEILV